MNESNRRGFVKGVTAAGLSLTLPKPANAFQDVFVETAREIITSYFPKVEGALVQNYLEQGPCRTGNALEDWNRLYLDFNTKTKATFSALVITDFLIYSPVFSTLTKEDL